MSTNINSKLFSSKGSEDHLDAVLNDEIDPADEYELQIKLIWQYFKQQQEQRGDPVVLESFLESEELQGEAYRMWEEQGLQTAFRFLIGEHQAGSLIREGKTKPADGTDEDEGHEEKEDSDSFVPDISLDDVLERRAQRQSS